MDSFIIRIYRYEKDKPRKLVGIVEHVGTEGKKAFTHFEELWEILNNTGQLPKRKQQDRGDTSDTETGKGKRGKKQDS